MVPPPPPPPQHYSSKCTHLIHKADSSSPISNPLQVFSSSRDANKSHEPDGVKVILETLSVFVHDGVIVVVIICFRPEGEKFLQHQSDGRTTNHLT
jgi:hypothetical protein